MNSSRRSRSANDGFTLTEMLVVIVIIGVLAAFLFGAAQRARLAARITAMHADVEQMQMAITNYQSEYSELPADFTDPDAVIRHVRKAFPRYVPGVIRSRSTRPNPDGRPDSTAYQQFANDVYYGYCYPGDPTRDPSLGSWQPTIDPMYPNTGMMRFDPASALVFFLGGLPESADPNGAWIPAGFHADPAFPFQPGLPRTEPVLKFDPKRVVRAEEHPDHPGDPAWERYLRYYPDGVEAPYVYFKARRYLENMDYSTWPPQPRATPRTIWGYAFNGPVQFAYVHSAGDPALNIPANICVPYRDPDDPPFWRNHDTCQIIGPGPDGQFGATLPEDPSRNQLFRVTRKFIEFTKGDYDNLANFARRTLEDETQ